MQGKRLGSYTLISELGSGGMGKVYEAKAQDGSAVALKIVHPHLLESPGFFKRFLREAEIGKRVQHENVVRTLDVDALTVEGQHHNFLVMEFVEGQTLRELLLDLGSVPEELCRHIGREAAKGLAAIHAAGVIHRDLKPENVLITPDHIVKVMDLGVARLADEAIRLSHTGAFVGSVLYAAPEQFQQEDSDPRADLYALGLVLYELCTGHHPFASDDAATVMRRQIQEMPRPPAELNPQLSPFLEEIIKALLAKDRDDRFSSADDLCTALQHGEHSEWWIKRAKAIRTATKRPLRRIRIPRETALYGRDEDLSKLRAVFDKVRSGTGQVILLEGEAGIGKTRLVDDFVGRLLQEGEEIDFLFGSYPPGGAATATGAFSTAYREHFGEEGLTESLTGYLKATPLLVPAFAALLRGDSTPEGSERLTKDSLQRVFADVTRTLAAERTVVVLIDDLHFAPEEGRAVFAALASAVADFRALLIGTYRPPMSKEWLSSIERLDHASRFALARLGPKDLGYLLLETFGSERLAQELALQIATKSDGNPFFVFEIVRGLREERYITKEKDGAWVQSRVIEKLAIPSSIVDLIQARLTELEEEDKELLDVAACCGFEFDPGLVAEALSLERIPMLKRLARVENRHRLIHSAGLGFVFDHHQVQEALYAALPGMLRQEYHASLARVLEQREETAAREPGQSTGAMALEICRHWLEAGRGQDAAPHVKPALEHLADSYMHDRAIRLADQALAEPDVLTGTERVALMLRKCRHLDMLGRREEERACLDESLAAAEAGGNPADVCRALMWLGFHLDVLARYDEAEVHLRRATELAAESGDQQLQASALGRLAIVVLDTNRFREAQSLFEKAIALARKADDRRQLITHPGNLAITHFMLGDYEDAEGQLQCSRELAIELGVRAAVAYAHDMLCLIHTRLGRFASAMEHGETALAMARETLDRRRGMWCTGALACLLHERGRVDAALEQFEASLTIAREIGHRQGEAGASGNLGHTHLALGDLDRARALFDRQLAMGREDRDLRIEAHALHGLGGLAEVTQSLTIAQEQHGEALSIRRKIEYRRGLALSLFALADIDLQRGELDSARARLDECLSHARALREPAILLLATVAHNLLPGGDLGAASNALEEWEEGSHYNARMSARMRLWKARKQPGDLAEAFRALNRLRDHAPEEYRTSMIENVPLHRDIMRAWEEHGTGSAS